MTGAALAKPPGTGYPSPMTGKHGRPPDLADIEDLARRAMAALPAEFRTAIGDVALIVEEFPDEATLADMGIESPFELAGLYRGVPATEKSFADPAPFPDTIHLYRRPILDWWAEEGMPLDELILHLVVHEIGHHFGLSDEDMERIEAAAEGALDRA